MHIHVTFVQPTVLQCGIVKELEHVNGQLSTVAIHFLCLSDIFLYHTRLEANVIVADTRQF